MKKRSDKDGKIHFSISVAGFDGLCRGAGNQDREID